MIGRTCLFAWMLIGMVLPHPGRSPRGNPPVEGPAYELVTKSAKRIKVELAIEVKTPNIQADEWSIYAPQFPELPGQVDVLMALSPPGTPVREMSQAGRPMLVTRMPSVGQQWRQGVKLRVDCEATLLERRLEKREPGTPAPPAVAPLDARTRRLELANFHQFEYQSAPFRAWLNEHKLRREPGENDVDLARRAFLVVRKELKHSEGDGIEHIAANVCEAGKSDFLGLTAVYVAALRANGIPTRVLSGRVVIMNGQPTKKSWPHAKVEFYVSGIGWIPADPAGAIRSGRETDGLEFFGVDTAEFLTTHIDTDIVIETIRGETNVEMLADVNWQVIGSGNFVGAQTKVNPTIKVEPLDLAEVLARKPARPGTKKPAAKKGR